MEDSSLHHSFSLHHSHSSARSKPRLQPTPHLTTRQGIRPESPWMLGRFISTEPWQELPFSFSTAHQYRWAFPAVPATSTPPHTTHSRILRCNTEFQFHSVQQIKSIFYSRLCTKHLHSQRIKTNSCTCQKRGRTGQVT